MFLWLVAHGLKNWILRWPAARVLYIYIYNVYLLPLLQSKQIWQENMHTEERKRERDKQKGFQRYWPLVEEEEEELQVVAGSRELTSTVWACSLSSKAKPFSKEHRIRHRKPEQQMIYLMRKEELEMGAAMIISQAS